MEVSGSDRVQDLITVGLRAAEQSSGENFVVAARIIPQRPRDLLNRLYRFARFVDDVGDEASGDRSELLDIVESQVRALDPAFDGVPTLPAVADLRPLLVQCDAPIQPLLDLIAANRMDQVRTSYPAFDDLLGYCALSAAPVGRMVLHVAGAATTANVAASDAVCAALQILEHCQDVGEDARAGRVYLPQADLHELGVAPDNLLASATSPAVRALVRLQVARARRLLRSGRPLVQRLHGWARLAVGGYVAGGLATAAALERHDCDVLARSIRPSRAGTAARALALVAVPR